MELRKIYDTIDLLAPFGLSKDYCERYDMRDNSGIQLDCGGEIGAILFSLDLSKGAVYKARQFGARCIVTHHPAIFEPLKSLTEQNCAPLLVCARLGISVISAHLNLDTAACGIDDCMMRGLGGIQAEALMHRIEGGGYGRAYHVPPCGLNEFAMRIQQVFLTCRILFYGTRPVSKVASFCGAGLDEQSVEFAVKQGVDTVVSSDAKHHIITALVEKGINVVLMPHYSAELYGFKNFVTSFNEQTGGLGVRNELFTDERFL